MDLTVLLLLVHHDANSLSIHAATLCNQHYSLIVPSIRADRLLYFHSPPCVCVCVCVCVCFSKSDRVLNTAQRLTGGKARRARDRLQRSWFI